MGKVINVGAVITDSQEGRLLQSDANTEAQEFLTEVLQIAYSGRETQDEALVLLGMQTPKQPVISVVSPRFASRTCTRRHRLRILRVWARAINILRRHIWVSLVPRPLFRFYTGSGYSET